MARIACMLVPNFSVAAMVRANASLLKAPFALAKTLAPHSELIAISSTARRAGIFPGMTIAQAHSILPGLTVTNNSEAAEQSAMEALADAAESISPLAEPGENGCVWLDLAGLTRLYGSETELAAEILRRAAKIGLDASVGIACNKELAHLAARCSGTRIIPAGREPEFVNWLPLDVLGLDAEGGDLEVRLARWGLRRLGDLARLDTDAIGTRLGRRGIELIRIARGENPAPMVPRRRAEVFSEGIELDYGIETLEPLAFVMRPMLERLCERLSMRGLVAGTLVLTMDLPDHSKFIRRVVLGAPTIEVRAILALITLSLEAAPPDAPAESIRIEVDPCNPRAAQSDMFLPPMPAPDRLELTIARLSALCGADHIGSIRANDSYRPEAVRVEKFDPPPPMPLQSNGNDPAQKIVRLVIRAIRPATKIEVLLNRGLPEFVRGENLGARVVSSAGPWQRESEWTCRRAYYDLALADGGVYRVFHDLASEQWFLDGVYD